MKLRITKKQEKLAKIYSQKVKVGYYAVKYSQAEATARRQHYIGKIGEFALYNLFKDLGYDLSEPDCEIHAQKRHEPDLIVDKYQLHIKTQRIEEALLYGHSWLFKKASIDASSASYAALITIYRQGLWLDALIPMKTLLKRFKAPKLNKLKTDVVAIYKKDLPSKPYIKLLTRGKNKC